MISLALKLYLDEQLAKMLETYVANKRTIEILDSVKGVGNVTNFASSPCR